MALINFSGDLILGIALVSVGFIVAMGMVWFFSDSAAGMICRVTADARGDALDNPFVAEELAISGNSFVTVVLGKFAWPLLCRPSERDISSANADEVSRALASLSVSAWKSLGEGKYRLLVGDEDSRHINAKRMGVFSTKVEGEFYPSDFYDFTKDNTIGEVAISEIMPKVHFISNGKIIDGIDEPISGDAIFTVFYADRVTGGIAYGSSNFFGLAVINAPECGIYGGFPDEITMASLESQCAREFGTNWLAWVDNNEVSYCECKYALNKKEGNPIPVCSYQLPKDNIWICVQEGGITPDAAYSDDTTPPEIIGFEVCGMADPSEVCQPIGEQAEGVYGVETKFANPTIRAIFAETDQSVVKDSTNKIVGSPAILYGECDERYDCSHFTVNNPPLETDVTYTFEFSDVTGNLASADVIVRRKPSIGVTVDATDFVNSIVDISLSANGDIKGLKVSVAQGENIKGPKNFGDVSSGTYSTFFDGFTTSDEGEWNIIVEGTDDEGGPISHLSEKTFVVDLTPPDVFVDSEFTQNSGYLRGTNPDVSSKGTKFYITYNGVFDKNGEVYIVESD